METFQYATLVVYVCVYAFLIFFVCFACVLVVGAWNRPGMQYPLLMCTCVFSLVNSYLFAAVALSHPLVQTCVVCVCLYV